MFGIDFNNLFSARAETQNVRANALAKEANANRTISMLEDELASVKRKLKSSEESESSAKRRIDELEFDLRREKSNNHYLELKSNENSDVKLKGQLSDLRTELRITNEVLKNKTGLLKEWMLSNDAFKKIARRYGGMLNLSPEEIEKDYDSEIISIVNADPQYEETRMYKKVQDRELARQNKDQGVPPANERV